MMFAKLRILPFFCLLAAVACSGGAGPMGGGPVGGEGGPGGAVGGGNLGNSNPGGGPTNAATPLQGGFSDPGGDPGENNFTLTTESVIPICHDSLNNLNQFDLKGTVQGPNGKFQLDGRVLRVVLTGSSKFFDETLTGGMLDLNGIHFYYGTFEFSLMTTQPFQIQFYLLPEGVPNSGESLQACSSTLCSPPGAIDVKHSLGQLQEDVTVLQECPTHEQAPLSI